MHKDPGFGGCTRIRPATEECGAEIGEGGGGCGSSLLAAVRKDVEVRRQAGFSVAFESNHSGSARTRRNVVGGCREKRG